MFMCRGKEKDIIKIFKGKESFPHFSEFQKLPLGEQLLSKMIFHCVLTHVLVNWLGPTEQPEQAFTHRAGKNKGNASPSQKTGGPGCNTVVECQTCMCPRVQVQHRDQEGAQHCDALCLPGKEEPLLLSPLLISTNGTQCEESIFQIHCDFLKEPVAYYL